MAKKLDFKDFLTVDYAPGMPDLIKKNAKKRKLDSGAGTNAEYSSTYSPEEQIDTIGEQKGDPIALGKHAPNVGMGYTGKHKTIKDPGSKKGRSIKVFQFTGEEADIDEALTLSQRRARGRKMKLKRRQIEVGRKRALKRAADPKRLKTRAEKAARNAIFRKLAKGKSRDEVPPQRKQEIESRMDKMKSRIQRLAIKLLPKVRQIDKERRVSKQDDNDK
jgi:hypothetical protein